MAIQSLWLQNVTYPARHDRLTFDALWTEGVLGTGSLQVAPSSPAAMTVRAAAGIAVVTGDDQTNQGKYLIRNDATVTGIAIAAAPGSGQRNDLIVLQVRDPNATGPAGDDAVVQVVAGTPSLTPVDPAIPNSALVLARVRVPAGTISITAGLIDDLRVTASDAYATTPAGSITTAMLSAPVAEALAPAGTILPFAGSSVPSGWLLCDGQAVSTTTYATLFAAIGSAYNTSAGQSAPAAGNFRVPILTGRVPVGRNGSDPLFATLGLTGGASSVTLTGSESGVAAHTHTGTLAGNTGGHSADHNHTTTISGLTSFVSADHNHSFTTASGGSHSHSVDVEAASTSHSHGAASASDYLAGEPSGGLMGGATSAPINSAGSHTHTGTTGGISANHFHTFSGTGTSGGASVNHTHGVNFGYTTNAAASASAAAAHNNLQPYITINYIIKT